MSFPHPYGEAPVEMPGLNLRQQCEEIARRYREPSLRPPEIRPGVFDACFDGMNWARYFVPASIVLGLRDGTLGGEDLYRYLLRCIENGDGEVMPIADTAE